MSFDQLYFGLTGIRDRPNFTTGNNSLFANDRKLNATIWVSSRSSGLYYGLPGDCYRFKSEQKCSDLIGHIFENFAVSFKHTFSKTASFLKLIVDVFIIIKTLTQSMLRTHLKFFIRVFLKDKFFSLLNILGLALGIAVSIILLLILQHDLNYDKHYANHERIYRVGGHLQATGLEFAGHDHRVSSAIF